MGPSEFTRLEDMQILQPKAGWHLLALALLAPLWGLLVVRVLQPRLPFPVGLAGVLLPPLLVVGVTYAVRSFRAREAVRRVEDAKNVRARADQEEAERCEAQRKHDHFSLEVLGLGLVLDQFRQSEVWEALQEKASSESMLSPDPGDLEDAMSEAESEALRAVLGWLDSAWPLPTFLATPSGSCHLLEERLERALGGGSLDHLSVRGRFDDSARLIPESFAFMDEHPDAPAVLLVAGAGRLYEDVPFEPERPFRKAQGVTVALLLGRKDRLEAMKALVDSESGRNDSVRVFWERERIEKQRMTYAPTELLPGPWSQGLLDRFFNLPVLAHLHRPQSVPFPEGIGDASRSQAILKAWNTLLENLDEPKVGHLLHHAGVPARRLAAPYLRAMAEEDPDRDVLAQGFDLYVRIGETGAAAPLFGVALAVQAAQRGSAASHAFLADPQGAQLVLARPAPSPDLSDASTPL